MKWAYGVTTVPSRRACLLPRTLASLAKGGFDSPRLFVDGLSYTYGYNKVGSFVDASELAATYRHPPAIGIVGNWILSLWELYLRDPKADRYAIFQDDIVTYPNLRQYLEQCAYPKQGYWNLCTYPQNDAIANDAQGWYLSNQMGRGGQALVFNREAVGVLLRQEPLVLRCQNVHKGHRNLDGAVSVSFRQSNWKEYVHNPSLVDHTGCAESTKGVKPQPVIRTFRGEQFDAMELLQCKTVSKSSGT